MYPETAPFKTGSGVLPDTIDDVPVGGHRSILYVNLRELRRHRPWVPGSRQIFLAAPVGLCPQGHRWHRLGGCGQGQEPCLGGHVPPLGHADSSEGQ